MRVWSIQGPWTVWRRRLRRTDGGYLVNGNHLVHFSLIHTLISYSCSYVMVFSHQLWKSATIEDSRYKSYLDCNRRCSALDRLLPPVRMLLVCLFFSCVDLISSMKCWTRIRPREYKCTIYAQTSGSSRSVRVSMSIKQIIPTPCQKYEHNFLARMY